MFSETHCHKLILFGLFYFVKHKHVCISMKGILMFVPMLLCLSDISHLVNFAEKWSVAECGLLFIHQQNKRFRRKIKRLCNIPGNYKWYIYHTKEKSKAYFDLWKNFSICKGIAILSLTSNVYESHIQHYHLRVFLHIVFRRCVIWYTCIHPIE